MNVFISFNFVMRMVVTIVEYIMRRSFVWEGVEKEGKKERV